jgi:DUF4097 and DUF4098 domain-containing protein YvlB
MSRLAAAVALGLLLPAAHAATSFDETRKLQPDARVSLDNLKGLIQVDTWDRAEIRIAGQRGDGTTGLLIEGDAAELKVKIEYPEGGGSWFGGWGSDRADDSELRVTVPVGVALTVDSVTASIVVRGVAGATLEVDNVSGDVDLDTGANEVEVNTVSGDAKIAARSGDVDVESVSGDVEVSGALVGRIQLEAVSGRLVLDSSGKAKQVDAGVVSGDIELRTGLQPGGKLKAESLSGNLVVVLPRDASARVNASSFTGSIRSPLGKVETEEHGPGSSLETTLGSGDGRIDLETFSGDLQLRQE